MMEWTDNHYRTLARIITKHAWLYTEMIAAETLFTSRPIWFLAFSPQQHPIVLQLGGSNVENLAKAAKLLMLTDTTKLISSFCGCPSPKVAGHGCFGVSLMLKPKLVGEAMSAIAANTNVPVTVKCRIGVDDHDSYDELCDFIYKVSTLSPTRHFIFRYEYFYALVRDFPDLRFTINGGITSVSKVNAALKKGAHGVMPMADARTVDTAVYGVPSSGLTRRQVLEQYQVYGDSVLGTHGNGRPNVRDLVKPLLNLFHSENGNSLWKRRADAAFKECRVWIVAGRKLEGDPGLCRFTHIWESREWRRRCVADVHNECLNGEFVRVGPNPKFDGDGYVNRSSSCLPSYLLMIHGVRIKDGKATYVSRLLRHHVLSRKSFRSCQIHEANTALVYHHGKLLALQEADKPYVIKVLEDGDLQTLGIIDYDKRLTHSFTAHPKLTRLRSHTPPYLTYRVISKDGIMHDPVPITISEPIMMHDFAITETYAIFMDLPMHFRPKEMVKEKKMIYSFDPTKKARFGVLPRYAKDELMIRWFELPNCFIFHNANAWEEEDEVVLITCRLENPDLDMVSGKVKEKLENFGNELYEMRFNMKTGSSFSKNNYPHLRLISPESMSATPESMSSPVSFVLICTVFPARKPHHAQRFFLLLFGAFRNRDTYMEQFWTVSQRLPESSSLICMQKLRQGKECWKYEVISKEYMTWGEGRYGSEAIYVPRETAEEDDGYLIFFVHDENTGKSCVTVIDAKTMSAEPVAVVELPHRVPYGFHALFVTEEQLQEQTLI
ncbi:Carotenoid oxygenase [Arabidopsis thaliana x Arabidopsis arenosa]|uniref:Carotenoid oxygenase n=1 Tax=Arabidopsis thaliana x Arabidopsis arenosa TaxID=1240361 RepID=A0A8T1XG59_9BRAS|nr:Carotenoid oxygenase [Arabidopsis thaliana x Arabidopsis arenosa]